MFLNDWGKIKLRQVILLLCIIINASKWFQVNMIIDSFIIKVWHNETLFCTLIKMDLFLLLHFY